MDANELPRIDRLPPEAFLTQRKSAEYRPNTQSTDWYNAAFDGRPRFNYFAAVRMSKDPQVQFGMRILRAPLYQLEVDVEASSERVGRYVRQQFQDFWDASLRRILTSQFTYGPSVGETTHRLHRGRIVFDRFDDFRPGDCRPLVRRKIGKQVGGKLVGVRVQGGGCAAFDIYCPHAFWHSGDAEYGQFWPRPRIADAYEPWLEKRGKNGAVDCRRLWFKKGAFTGGQLRYPLGKTTVTTDDGGSYTIDNQDLAQRILDQWESGGTLSLPNTRDQQGNYKWEFTPPGAGSEVKNILDYPKELDTEILKGLGIPPEIVEAATVGSGYSGRAIPAQVFFSSEDEIAADLVRTIDTQTIKPAVRTNFGPRAEYRIRHRSLAKLVAESDPRANAQRLQEPDPRQAMGGGLPGLSLSLDSLNRKVRRLSRQIDLGQPERDPRIAALYDLMLQAAARIADGDEGAQDELDALAELAAEITHGNEPIDLAWIEHGTSRSGKKRWKDDQTGKLRYQESKPGEARERRDRSHAKANELIEAFHLSQNDPGNHPPLTPKQWGELADHMPAMTKDKLRNVRNQLLQGVRDQKTHREWVEKLQGEVKARLEAKPEVKAEDNQGKQGFETPYGRAEIVEPEAKPLPEPDRTEGTGEKPWDVLAQREGESRKDYIERVSNGVPTARAMRPPTPEEIATIRDELKAIGIPIGVRQHKTVKGASLGIYRADRDNQVFTPEEQNQIREVLRRRGVVSGFDGKHMNPADYHTSIIGNLLMDVDGPHPDYAQQPTTVTGKPDWATPFATYAQTHPLAGRIDKARQSSGTGDNSVELTGRIKDEHFDRIKKALAQGKPVPAEVLADYPDLARGPDTAERGPDTATPDGPKEGDRDANGLVFKDGRWRREGEDGEQADGETPKQPKPGRVYNVKTTAIKADPKRFQYKFSGIGADGVTDELKGVEKFNPDFGGVIAVWRDPEDGETYVINGHHRFELAMRSGHPELAVRYLDAPSAELARATGALINIAEGRGTATDAAKFLRDTGSSIDDLKQHGISLKGAVARDAAILVKLSPELFRKMSMGQLDEDRAKAIAAHLPNQEMQGELLRYIETQEEKSGKEYTPKVVAEAAREMASTPTVKSEDGGGFDLFGGADDEKSVFMQRNELKAHIRNELARERRDFSAVASTRRAEAVSKAGNVIDVEKNKQIANETLQHADVFDTNVNYRGGEISTILNDEAEAYASARSPKQREEVRKRATERVRTALAKIVVQGTGSDLPASETRDAN